jgi:hypothetical protein
MAYIVVVPFHECLPPRGKYSMELRGFLKMNSHENLNTHALKGKGKGREVNVIA